MTARKRESKSSTNRWWLVIAVAALGVAFYLAQRNSGLQRENTSSISDAANPAGMRSSTASEGAGSPLVTRSSMDRSGEGDEDVEDDTDAPVYPRIEEILANDSLSESQAAVGLLGLVQNRELSVEERDEALAHGLNLDFKVFASLATDSSLPVNLAERMIDELANLNEVPQQQIEGYLGFMNYRDAEIRTQASEDLAFILEDEDLAESPEELRRMALERLEELKKVSHESDPSGAGKSASGFISEQ